MQEDQRTAEWRELRAEITQLTKKIEQLTRIVRTSPGVRAVSIDNATVLVRLMEGQRLYVDTGDLSIAPHLLMSGTWEPQHVRVMRALIRPGQLCIDAGANFGYFTVHMASMVKRGGSVVAFEPNPRLFDLLTRSLWVNGFHRAGITVAHRVALADHAGAGHLSVPRSFLGGGSLSEPDEDGAHADFDRYEVELRTLDSYELDCDRPVFIKIDCEGAEPALLKGAERTLARAGDLTILMEFTPAFIERSMPVPEFCRYLADLGLRAHLLSEDGRSFMPVTMSELSEAEPGYVFLSRHAL